MLTKLLPSSAERRRRASKWSTVDSREALVRAASRAPRKIVAPQATTSRPSSASRTVSCTRRRRTATAPQSWRSPGWRSEEHTSELQSRGHLVCRLLLEKKKFYDERCWQMDMCRDWSD